MRTESGRSLIEIIGVLAVAAIMTAGAIGMYKTMRDRSMRTIATAELDQVAKNVRLMMAPRGDYSGVSVDYLVKAGALRNDRAPIGGDDWSITASDDGTMFSINLTGLSYGDCAYFTTAIPTWASGLRVNGYSNADGMPDFCMSSGDNMISFMVE